MRGTEGSGGSRHSARGANLICFPVGPISPFSRLFFLLERPKSIAKTGWGNRGQISPLGSATDRGFGLGVVGWMERGREDKNAFLEL